MSWNVRVKIPADEYWGDLEGETLAGAERVVETAGDLAVGRIRQLLEPSRITGEMAAGAKRDPAKRSGATVFTRVYNDHPGAARREFGAVDKRGIRTLPHPTFRPAFEELQGKIAALFHAWAGRR